MSLLGRRRGQVGLPLDVPEDTRIVLHVGCGPRDPESLHPKFRGPDWREVRLDIDSGVEPDIVSSIVDMSSVPSTAVDAVWSSHNLEHVYAHEVATVLDGFHRVLRPSGTLLVTLPDLQEVAKRIALGRLEDPLYTSPAGPIAPLDVVYGHRPPIERGNDFMAHRTGFTAKTLKAKLVAAGFEGVQVTPKEYALWGRGRKAG